MIDQSEYKILLIFLEYVMYILNPDIWIASTKWIVA